MKMESFNDWEFYWLKKSISKQTTIKQIFWFLTWFGILTKIFMKLLYISS